MQEVYRINIIPSYKPWRGGYSITLTDKVLFDAIKNVLEGGDSINSMAAPDAALDEYGCPIDEDYTMSEWLYNQNGDIKMPYVLMDECDTYVE